MYIDSTLSYQKTIKRHKNTLKKILKEDRKDRNRAEFGLEYRICTLIQLYHIKRESWFSDAKLNGVNSRILMNKYEWMINNIRDVLIDMNKGTTTEDNKQILNEMDHIIALLHH